MSDDRRAFIGGSDIAAVLGIQPPRWRTGYATWVRKVAPEPPDAEPRAGAKVLARGTIVEPLVATYLAQQFRLPASVRNRRHVDPEVPYFAAEIDAEFVGADILACTDASPAFAALARAGLKRGDVVNGEIKSVSPWHVDEWGIEPDDAVPLHYAAQTMWGLGVTRRRFAIAIALFGADEVRLYPIIRDEETVQGMRARADAWWRDYVLAKVPPPASTIGDTKAMWPKDSGLAKDANSAIIGAVRALREMKEKAKTYKNGCDGAELLIREFMQDASELVDPATGDEIATLKAQPTRSIDSAKLKAEHPEVYKAVARVGSTRVLRTKGDE